jgi:hypothetical protein
MAAHHEGRVNGRQHVGGTNGQTTAQRFSSILVRRQRREGILGQREANTSQLPAINEVRREAIGEVNDMCLVSSGSRT